MGLYIFSFSKLPSTNCVDAKRKQFDYRLDLEDFDVFNDEEEQEEVEGDEDEEEDDDDGEDEDSEMTPANEKMSENIVKTKKSCIGIVSCFCSLILYSDF